LVQASVLVPSMFIAQEPQMPSRQDRRSVSVGSILFLIHNRPSSTIGPQSSVSTWIGVDARILPVIRDQR
jgi:hypothetical protein